jgi:pimeloyl-ACP methyl ester carboxylesterase
MEKLILLHGALGAAQQFDELADHLAKKFEIHSFNFSGHGGEPLPQAGYSFDLFSRDIQAYMDRAEIREAHFFGYSMGGYAALCFAHKAPKRVKKIFTLATKFGWTEESAKAETRFLDPVVLAAKVPAFARILADRHSPQDWRSVVRETAAFMIRLGLEPELKDGMIPEIECPVRISIGDKDSTAGLEDSVQTYRQLEKGSLWVIPETQHPFEKVDKDRLCAEILAFFSE